MKDKRAKYMLAGAIVLAFFAAILNVHCLLTFGVAVSHVTGSISLIAAKGDRAASLLNLTYISILGFFFGAMFSGIFLHSNTFAFKRPYGVVVTLIGTILLTAFCFERINVAISLFLVAFSCGAQNAMSTFYRGLIIRTTHMTGPLTDIGQMLGRKIAGDKIETWKIRSLFWIVLSFSLGAFIGIQIHHINPSFTLLIVGLIYLLMGISWYLGKKYVLSHEIASA